MIETTATVDANEEIAPGYRLLVARIEGKIQPQPGQFAMIRPLDSLEPLLRRALAVYRIKRSGSIDFLYQVLGRGTQALSRLRPGDYIEVLAPLGNRWPVDKLVQSRRRIIVVSGGIGSASLLMLCEALKERGAEFKVLFGARSKGDAGGCGLEDFNRLDVPLLITTDDGSFGERGLVTAPLERCLNDPGDNGLIICACGPWPMMARVAEIAERSGTECLVSLEAPMGCGFGVCVGCVVSTRGESSSSFDAYKRVCIDGPIFSAEKIRWDVNPIGH